VGIGIVFCAFHAIEDDDQGESAFQPSNPPLPASRAGWLARRLRCPQIVADERQLTADCLANHGRETFRSWKRVQAVDRSIVQYSPSYHNT
jgi:hypothetical protein